MKDKNWESISYRCSLLCKRLSGPWLPLVVRFGVWLPDNCGLCAMGGEADQAVGKPLLTNMRLCKFRCFMQKGNKRGSSVTS